jgi:HAD superfamily phosphatase (TIGR01668 family)
LKKFSELKPENGVKGMVFDVDDTLSKAKLGKRGVPQDLKNQLKTLQDSGVQLGIVSNNPSPEAALKIQKELADSGIAVDVVGGAHKPDTKGLQMMQQDFGLPADQMMMVGDNPDTDMKSGNRAGFKTAQADWFGNGKLHKAMVQKSDTVMQHIKGTTDPDDQPTFYPSPMRKQAPLSEQPSIPQAPVSQMPTQQAPMVSVPA